MNRKEGLIWPTSEQDAAITAAAMVDPDNPPLTDEELAQFKPASEYHTLERLLRRWCDQDVVDAYTVTGPDWERHINVALREWAERNGLLK